MTLQNKYLELLKNILLNEIYLENEVRFLYIFAMLSINQKVDGSLVREIGKRLPDLVERTKQARQEGRPWWNLNVSDPSSSPPSTKMLSLRNLCEFSHTMAGRKRLDNITYCLDIIRNNNVPGDLIETGVWRGGSSILMRGYLSIYEMNDRKVWVADSFEGLPVPSLPQDAGYDFSASKMPILAVSLEEVQENFSRYNLLDDQVHFLKGWFSDTLSKAPIEQLALLRLDGDLYESTMDSLNALYHKVTTGGFIIVDDYGDFEPCRRAVTEFRETHGIIDPIEKIDWAGAYWRKSQ
ncbi:MAG: class I SAM-dependent methyltransferase [Desulfamplus sp.]|nr:class I SAM-dependent methyltransferase [Desulfamplus sp.]